jgi:Flp pilus assembly protein TadG
MTKTTFTKTARRLLRDRCGSAAMELAFAMLTLTTLMINTIEFGRYYYSKVELENAVQMASYAVYQTCDTAAKLPAHTNCSARTAKITTALQSTSLGSSVTLASTAEGWYCLNTGGSLQNVANFTDTRPVDCSAAGSSTTVPADYFLIIGQTSYTPIFSGVSIASTLPGTLTKTSIVRMQ